MRKTLAFIVTAFVINFAGCSSASVASDTKESNLPTGDISAYMYAPYMDAEAVGSKLSEAGFEVLTTYKMKKIGTTVVFTDTSMKTMANQPGRGFAAVSRIFIDDANKRISINNPVYFHKAYMQDQYDNSISMPLKEKLVTTFNVQSFSEDKLNFDELADYHYMMGMPYYADVDTLAEGEQSALVASVQAYSDKLTSKKKPAAQLFKVELAPNRVLIGLAVGKKTSKFPKKIGTHNGGVLPWLVLIEDGKAISLNGKYHVAISYPLLSMSEFMKIATMPGAVEKDLKKAF